MSVGTPRDMRGIGGARPATETVILRLPTTPTTHPCPHRRLCRRRSPRHTGPACGVGGWPLSFLCGVAWRSRRGSGRAVVGHRVKRDLQAGRAAVLGRPGRPGLCWRRHAGLDHHGRHRPHQAAGRPRRHRCSGRSPCTARPAQPADPSTSVTPPSRHSLSPLCRRVEGPRERKSEELCGPGGSGRNRATLARPGQVSRRLMSAQRA